MDNDDLSNLDQDGSDSVRVIDDVEIEDPKEEMKARGPGSYKYCEMELGDDWSLCEPISKKDKNACGLECAEKYGKFTYKLEQFRLAASQQYTGFPDTATAEAKFEEIQTYYENILAKLMIMRSERKLLWRQHNELNSQRTEQLNNMANHPENFDPT